MAFDILKNFLQTEITEVNSFGDQKMYNAIRNFLTSYEIREGKFEANLYLLNKLNRDTVIIYQESETSTGNYYSMDARICHIPHLISQIDNVAKSHGLEVPGC